MHGTIELLAGIAMIVAPAALGFGATGIIVSVLLGSILMGMGVALTSQGGAALPWHTSFDSAFGLVTAVAAVMLAASGDHVAGIFLAALAIVQAGLNSTTRYVAAC